MGIYAHGVRLNEELRLYLYENYKRCFERKIMMNEDYSSIKQLKDVLSEANGKRALLLPEGCSPPTNGGARRG